MTRKDTNVALIGTDQDKAARYAAAKSEEAYKGAGSKVGLEIWRVENHPATETKGPDFGIQRWPTAQFGSFYQGDSYIVMRTYKKDPKAEKLDYDIHYWLGRETSQDEMGVAAYKTVELDDLLKQVPVQHREIQGGESQLFLSYFPKGIRILQGGIDSGFNPVKPETYHPRLLQVKGKKNIRATQVPLQSSSLNENDVFILDLGLEIIEWDGQTSSPLERRKASELCNEIRSERNGKPTYEVIASGTEKDDCSFWKALGGKKPVAAKSSVSDEDADNEKLSLKIFKLSDDSGKLKMTEVKIAGGQNASQVVQSSALGSGDVYLVDSGIQVYAWVGKGASKEERGACMRYAEQYLQDANRPRSTPITRVLEGNEPSGFTTLFAPADPSSSSSSSASATHGDSTASAPAPHAGNRQDVFVCTVLVKSIATETSGDMMSKSGEWFVDCSGDGFMGTKGGRYPRKGNFRLGKKDKLVLAGEGEVVFTTVVDAFHAKSQFHTVFRVCEQDPITNDIFIQESITLPLQVGTTPFSRTSKDGKVTVDFLVDIRSYASWQQKGAHLPQVSEVKKTLNVAELKPIDSAAIGKKDLSGMVKKDGKPSYMVNVRLIDMHVDESGEWFSKTGEFYMNVFDAFSFTGHRFPNDGVFTLSIGDSLVPTVKGAAIFSLIAETDDDVDLKLTVKESDLLIDDTMLSASLKISLKAGETTTFYRLTSKNGKTIVDVAVQVERSEMF
jgi:gelsolin